MSDLFSAVLRPQQTIKSGVADRCIRREKGLMHGLTGAARNTWVGRRNERRPCWCHRGCGDLPGDIWIVCDGPRAID